MKQETKDRKLQEKRDMYVGTTIRNSLVIDVVRRSKHYSFVLECNECGNIYNRSLNKFLNNVIGACNINHYGVKHDKKTHKKLDKNINRTIYKNIIGQKIGRFIVIEHIGFHQTKNGYIEPEYKCQCECGEICNLTNSALKAGRKYCDKEFAEYKKQQGKRSAKKRLKNKVAKEPTFRRSNSRRIQKFSLGVYEKFGGVCQKCNRKFNKEYTASHHIIPIKNNEHIAFDVSNGILLCAECHNNFHYIYGNVEFDHRKIFEYISEQKQPQIEIAFYS